MVERTIIEWLSLTIDDDIRERALACHNKELLDDEIKMIHVNAHTELYESYSRALAFAFDWTKTDEGYSYWHMIYNKDPKDQHKEFVYDINIFDELIDIYGKDNI